MMTRREDLLSMNIEVLVALSNRGVVNRAMREMADAHPRVEETEKGIRAVFETGQTVELANGSALSESSCTCGATTMCRHRIALVLAYQSGVPDAAPHHDWSPGEFTDEQLADTLGRTALRKAHDHMATGYTATVHRGSRGHPEVRVDLPHATVRFLVPENLDHAHSSATRQAAAVTIVLAVWAARHADHTGDDVVHLGGDGPAASGTQAEYEVALGVVASVLDAGAAHLTESLRAELERGLVKLRIGTATWITDATAELLDMVDALAQRHTRFSRRRLCELMVEVHNRATLAGMAEPPIGREASGVDVTPETPIRRTIFTGLGARHGGTTESTEIDTFLYDRSAQTISVWKREASSNLRSDGPGTRGYLIASGSVIAESAVRLAGGRLRFSRTGPKSLAPLPPDPDVWPTLGNRIYITEFADLRRQLAERPPSFARKRTVAQSVVIVAIAHVGAVDYTPGDQTLRAWIHDSSGDRAMIETEYRPECAGALDAVADALRHHTTAVSGHVRLRDGELVVDPYALVTDGTIIVPQLLPDPPSRTIPSAVVPQRDPIVSLIGDALDVMGELAQRGLEQPTPSTADVVDDLSERASALRMTDTVQSLRSVADSLRAGPVEDRRHAWVAAATRLVVLSEFR
ncbi:hypothetical protein [Williamsia sp.]|uniref:hypothetical protein n=1 Tax=Williamsia sp. TaxID=1872085 RepID=UPI001A2824C6|nr:hypothetical protein [Williamsia sp.]MBJ7287511.1 hypothetical protein [Williamsia sp.]